MSNGELLTNDVGPGPRNNRNIGVSDTFRRIGKKIFITKSNYLMAKTDTNNYCLSAFYSNNVFISFLISSNSIIY